MKSLNRIVWSKLIWISDDLVDSLNQSENTSSLLSTRGIVNWTNKYVPIQQIIVYFLVIFFVAYNSLARKLDWFRNVLIFLKQKIHQTVLRIRRFIPLIFRSQQKNLLKNEQQFVNKTIGRNANHLNDFFLHHFVKEK